MFLKSLLIGIGSYLPRFSRLLRNAGTGGTINARYCYSVWLRHLVVAAKNGLPTQPKSLLEIGPGNSLGVGLAALLTGSIKYFALDIFKFTEFKSNLTIFEELVDLFKERANIPDNKEFPMLKPDLDCYEFPGNILSDTRLDSSLDLSRLLTIKNLLLGIDTGKETNIQISYFAPWYDKRTLKEESIDLILSQAVLEHVMDINAIYNNFYHWLKPNGFISHQIDLTSHNTAKAWNGHWTYSDFIWRLMKGKRPFLLNRCPYSVHIKAIQEAGFKIVNEIKNKEKNSLTYQKLASKFKTLNEVDLTTSGIFVQAIKNH